MNCVNCRGNAPVLTPTPSGQPRGDCPYKNIGITLGLLYGDESRILYGQGPDATQIYLFSDAEGVCRGLGTKHFSILRALSGTLLLYFGIVTCHLSLVQESFVLCHWSNLTGPLSLVTEQMTNDK